MSNQEIMEKLQQAKEGKEQCQKKELSLHQQYQLASDNQWWNRRIAGLLPTVAYTVSNSSLFQNPQVSGTIGMAIFSTAGLIKNIFSLRAGDTSNLTKASILLLGTLTTLGASYVVMDMVKTILLEDPSTAFEFLDYLSNVCHDVNVGLVALNALINGLSPDIQMPITEEKITDNTEDDDVNPALLQK